MIPVGDDTGRIRRKTVLVPLIANICVAVFILQFLFGDVITYAWSATAYELWHGMDLDHAMHLVASDGSQAVIPHHALPHPALIWLTPLTAIFLHGDVWHLLGNLIYLLVFGNHIEFLLGKPRFVLFYLGCGLIATVAQLASDVESIIPMLGASGAISGILGAYFRRFPWKLITFWIFPLPLFLPVPAFIALGIWFLGQWSSLSGGQPGVAWLAHIGGFIAGFILVDHFRPEIRR